MDASRIRQGEMIAAVAAVALFVIMFLSWYSAPDVGNQVDAAQAQIDQMEEAGVPDAQIEQAQNALDEAEDNSSANAWRSFDFIDIIMLVTIIAAIALAAISASATQVNLPVAMSAVVAALGILSTLLVLFRVIDPVEDADRAFGLFLGLIAAAGIAYGGWRAMQEEGTSFSDQADNLQGGSSPGPGPGPGAPPPSQPPSGPAA
jgi:hypothetical protein